MKIPALVVLAALAAPAFGADEPLILVHRPAADYSFLQSRLSTASFVFDAAKRDGFQMDFRSCDLASYDLSKSTAMTFAAFNTATKFPAALPPGFDPARELELGKNPGLGVRALHAAGVTGKGVGVAVIDQALLEDHDEYEDRLRAYEELNSNEREASMHGPATASIAVGRTVGVAPEADLYFLETSPGGIKDGKWEYDLGWMAKAIDRIVEINRKLPKGRKIRVISISLGMPKAWKGRELERAAIERAAKHGVLVLTVENEVLPFDGLGREPLADPDDRASFGPGLMFTANANGAGDGVLQVPMDSRTVADPTGPSSYAFMRVGGQSWIVPWVAGLYALACQVRPDVTPAAFREAALATAKPLTVSREGREIVLKKVVDPAALIARLKGS